MEMDSLHSMDVVLPTDAGTELHLRTVSKPEKNLALLLERLDLHVPQLPRRIENVVQKT
jgi:hypothetical protein